MEAELVANNSMETERSRHVLSVVMRMNRSGKEDAGEGRPMGISTWRRVLGGGAPHGGCQRGWSRRGGACGVRVVGVG
jgi:hypothetical protein